MLLNPCPAIPSCSRPPSLLLVSILISRWTSVLPLGPFGPRGRRPSIIKGDIAWWDFFCRLLREFSIHAIPRPSPLYSLLYSYLFRLSHLHYYGLTILYIHLGYLATYPTTYVFIWTRIIY